MFPGNLADNTPAEDGCTTSTFMPVADHVGKVYVVALSFQNCSELSSGLTSSDFATYLGNSSSGCRVLTERIKRKGRQTVNKC